ncbi:MAG: hypothetical protein Q8K70_10405 [Bacteroidota bacterium]|nr:hypothetical protein [Bacteroidota bacterium]
MNDKQKIGLLMIALLCNFTFLATAQSNKPTDDAMKLPECIKSHGIDSLETRKNMSLFQEDFKNKDYDYAYKWWSYVFNNAPCSYKSIHQNGPAMISKMIDNPVYASRKAKLIDTLMMVFPTRIKYFGEEAFVKGLWAYYKSKYQGEQMSEIMTMYDYYYSNATEKLDEFYLRDYLRVAINASKKNTYSKENLFDLYDRMSTTAEQQKIANELDSVEYKNWDVFYKNIDKMMLPYLKGADIDAIFQPKLKANPEDKNLVNKVIKLYKSDPLYKDHPNFIGLIEKSYSLEPSALSAEQLARYFEGKKNMTKANFYYEKAAELSNDNGKKEDFYIKLAKNNISNINVAKSYANKALSINSNNGQAYIILGKAAYRNKCGNKLEQAAAACVAVDYFNKAKSVDPSCSAEANQEIANHSKFFPLKSDAFFYGLKEGDSYTIGCSGETTTIRVK